MTRHEGTRKALIAAFSLSPPPPAQYWPLACETLLKEGIGWVLEDVLMLDDCDAVGGSLRYRSRSRFCGSVTTHARASRSHLSILTVNESVARTYITPQNGAELI